MANLATGVRRVWDEFFYTGFSVEGLALLRICFGVGLFFFHFTQFNFLFEIDPTGLSFRHIEPMWYFELLGIDWHVPAVSLVMFGVLLCGTLAMAAGYRTKLAILLVLVCLFYLKGARDSMAGDVHHRNLVPTHMLFLLLLSRCGYAYSVDAWRGRARGRVEVWQASWPIKAMQVYTVSFYFWSAVAKLRMSGWAWVGHGQNIQDLLIGRSLQWGATETGEAVFNPFPYWVAQQETLCFLLAAGTLVMEFGFPLLLLLKSPKLRLVALSGVGVFHLATAALAYVGFALFPIVFFIFFDLEDVRRRLVAWWRRRRPLPISDGPASPGRA